MWSADLYLAAWRYAGDMHGTQKITGSELPYVVHVGAVAMEVIGALAMGSTADNPDLAVQCALLHDVIEDTPATFDDVAANFGLAVAQGVLALTKDATLPSKTMQMSDSLARIRQQPQEVWMVKLADRITNLQPPPAHWNADKIISYRQEAGVILSELGEANAWLALRLKAKIETYPG